MPNVRIVTYFPQYHHYTLQLSENTTKYTWINEIQKENNNKQNENFVSSLIVNCFYLLLHYSITYELNSSILFNFKLNQVWPIPNVKFRPLAVLYVKQKKKTTFGWRKFSYLPLKLGKFCYPDLYHWSDPL